MECRQSPRQEPVGRPRTGWGDCRSADNVRLLLGSEKQADVVRTPAIFPPLVLGLFRRLFVEGVAAMQTLSDGERLPAGPVGGGVRAKVAGNGDEDVLPI